MRFIPIFAIALMALAGTAPAYAGGDFFKKVCTKTAIACDGDVVDTDSTKNLNGRVGQSAALASVTDSRISTPGERVNLDLNWTTNDIGGPGAAGGSAFVNIPEVDDNLYVGIRGGHSFEGAGTMVGVGVSYAFDPADWF